MGGHLVVPVEPGLAEHLAAVAVHDRLRRWFIQRADERLPVRASIYAARLAIEVPPIKIVHQDKRWGSCDRRGRVQLNWQLVMAPTALIDYVVAHELCHVREHNHPRRFWRLLEAVMPDFPE